MGNLWWNACSSPNHQALGDDYDLYSHSSHLRRPPHHLQADKSDRRILETGAGTIAVPNSGRSGRNTRQYNNYNGSLETGIDFKVCSRGSDRVLIWKRTQGTALVEIVRCRGLRRSIYLEVLRNLGGEAATKVASRVERSNRAE